MAATQSTGAFDLAAAAVANRRGQGRFVIACDHASNFIPDEFGGLGLDAAERERHIAWDPGALPVARILSSLLDAPLVESRVSRLVCDCNRAPDAPDLVPTTSETTAIPGNAGLDPARLAARVAIAHAPFHDLLDEVIRARLSASRETWLVSVHSFTPVYRGIWRPWEIGIVHDDDQRLSRPLIEALKRREPGFKVGNNQPYSPEDRVYYTLERHARARNLPCAMIEIRNDEIAGSAGQRRYGQMLAEMLAGIVLDVRQEASVA